MSRFRALFAAAILVFIPFALGACGDSDDPVTKGVTGVERNGGGKTETAVTTSTTPRTCAEMRADRVTYDDEYRALRCDGQRRRLCSGLARSNARYDDYRCSTLKTASTRSLAARKRAAKRKLAAKKRAAARKTVAAKKRAAARKSASAGTKSSSATKRSTSSSPSRSSSSSSSSAGSSSSPSSSSTRSSSSRRR